MMDYSCYKIDYTKFNLSGEQFDQQSHIHGILHTYRVMLHCLRLGILSDNIADARVAFFGAYIHDMARLHDGYCSIHGADAARYKFPLYQKLYISEGATFQDLKVIKQIVTRHSIPNEPLREHEIFQTLALLKDADALDRIRLGRHDLDPKFLRLEKTHESISFGEDLYYATNNKSIKTFSDIIQIANDLDSMYGIS